MSWSETTKAKSDQLNADDLIGGPITIKITGVKVDTKAEQSGVIFYEGDNGKPYKPCKSMRRVIELKWGGDENSFVGRSMTLARDATVKWAGEEVGGIRISHMSHMKSDERFMLTYSRNVKRPYKVEHLVLKDDKEERAMAWAAKAKTEIMCLDSLDGIAEWKAKNEKAINALAGYKHLQAMILSEIEKVTQTLEK